MSPTSYQTAPPRDDIKLNGDPYGIRTRVTAVKGRCLNRLTNGPCLIFEKLAESKGFEPLRRFCRLHEFQSCSFGHSDSSPKEKVAPQVGFEPTTYRLTAGCSTTELLRNDLAWQRPILTGGDPPTTFGAETLNFRVRHGNGCGRLAIATRQVLY